MQIREQEHTTLGPLVSIEGHTLDGERFVIRVADVKSGPDGVVESCVLHSNTPDLIHDENGKMDLVYPTKTRRLNTPSRAVRDALAPTYTALHEGQEPGSYWRDLPRVGSELAKDALVIDAASYIKETRESDLHVYRHPIELSENRKPTLAISPNQELWFRNQGSVSVTERGIEDMEPTAINRAGDSRTNPYTKENIQRAAMSSLYAGGAAVAQILAVNAIIDNVEWLRINAVGYPGAIGKAVVGILGAVGVDGMLSEQQDEYRPIAAGIGVGGIVGGAMQAIDTYRMNNPAADTTPIPASFRDAAARTAWMTAHPTRTPVPEVYNATAPAGAASRHWGNEWSGTPANQQWGRTG